MKVLLDTCTFLWIAVESPRLSMTAVRLFRDPDTEVYLSTASSLEIAIKSSQGRLPLPEPAHSYVPSRRAVYRIHSLPVDEESALRIARLPRIHGDPFDRILVCQAVVHGMTILTPDEAITQYAVRVVW
jgi:PIN domain nuclease of toxin-antitoxin system